MMVLRIFHSRYVSSSSSMAAAALSQRGRTRADCACAEPRSSPRSAPCGAVDSERLTPETFVGGSAEGSPDLPRAPVGCTRTERTEPPTLASAVLAWPWPRRLSGVVVSAQLPS